MKRYAPWIVSALLLGAPVVAEETPTAPEKVSGLAPGTHVRIVGKYGELVDRELSLVDVPLKFRVRKEELLQKLLEFKSQKDNLVVSGVVVDAGDARAVDVEDLVHAPSDAELFRREVDSIPQGADRSDRLLAVLRRLAEVRVRYGEEEIEALARKTAADCLGAHDATLAPGEYEARVARFREVYGLVPDRKLAFEFLSDLDRRFPGRPEARALLQALHCRWYRGRWVTYEEFKKLEGFVVHEGRWVLPREKDFLDNIKVLTAINQTNLILRRRTEREYRLLAEKGTVEEGMRPEEVSLALGFPDRVERRLLSQNDFDQWAYAGKYYYFFGGLLVKKPAQ